MKALRIIAAIGAILIMAGEAYRSWGVGRPVYAWMDDMLAGSLMLVAAYRVGRPTVSNRALFSASWGIAVGMLYGSFFGKLFEPAQARPGNFNLVALTIGLGAAFALAVGGLIVSVVVRSETPSCRHAGLVPASTHPRALSLVAPWTPEQVRGDGGDA